MKPPRIIVSEASGNWAVALRREMGSPPLLIEETRTLDDARSALIAAPGSMLLVELRAPRAPVFLSWLAQQQRDFPHARLVVVASRTWEPWRWAVLEAGAVLAVFHPRELAAVVPIARSHLAHAIDAGPLEGEESTWSQLPWSQQPEGAP